MSKALQHFVDNFMKGAQLGLYWQDFASKAQDRKDARDIARAKNAIDAAKFTAQNALNTRRTAAYERDVAAKAAGVGYYDRARGRGGGAGVAAQPSAGAQQFDTAMTKLGLDTAAPDPQQPTTQTVQPEQPDVPDSTPPGDVTYDARGGKIPPQRFASGGKARRQQLMTSMMKAGQTAADKMNKPTAQTPQSSPNAVQPVGAPQGGYTAGGPTYDPSLRASAGTNGPGSGFGDTAAPPVTAPPTQAISTTPPAAPSGPASPDPTAGGGATDTSTGPDTSAYDQGADMDFARRGGRIRGRRIPRPRVPGFADGGRIPTIRTEADRQEAIRRAAKPDTSRIDQTLRDQDELIAPPGPREGSTAYARGGAVRRFASGGPVNSQQSPVSTDTDSVPTRSPFAGLWRERVSREDADREINRQLQGGQGNPYARAPQERFQQGGRVQGYEGGGTVVFPVPDGYQDDPNLSPEVRQQRLRDAIYPPRTPPGTGAAVAGAVPAEGARTTSGGNYGQANQQGSQRDDDDRAAAYKWSETTPGNRGGARTDRRPFSTEPPPRGTNPPFVGEEARADESGGGGGQTPGPAPNMPGQDYPTNTAEPEGKATSAGGKPPSGGGRGGARAAISTEPWKPLQDQTRTAAYDPNLDMNDPDNIHAVDPATGQSRAWTQQRVIMDDKGNVARVENPVGADYKSGAVNFADALGRKHPQEVYNGAGSPDPKMVENLMQQIDPNGQMTPGQRLEAATKAAHEYYVQQGQPQQADRVAFDLAQYGVGQSRAAGVAAAKAAQAGDLQGAAQQLVQGFSMVPNGQHASVQGNQIVVVDDKGKPVMQIPINPQTMHNLALGMATGKLGWDAMGYNPPTPPPPPQAVQTQAPGATRPAAQPSAAPAGPQPQPQPQRNGTVNIASLTGEAPTTGVAPGATGTATGQATAQQTPTGAAVPTNPAQPPTPPSGTAPSPVAPNQQQPQTPRGTGQGPTQQGSDEQEYFKKNPRGAYKTVDRQTAESGGYDQANAIAAKRKAAQDAYVVARNRVIQIANQLPMTPKERQARLTASLASLKTQFTQQDNDYKAQIKDAQTRQEAQDTFDRQNTTAPRPVGVNDEATLQQSFQTQLEKVEADPALRKGTVLETLKTPQDRAPVYHLARQIWQQNKGVGMDDAMNYALGVTAIKPEGQGMNYAQGKDALQFRAHGNQRQGYSLTLPSGERILVDHNTLLNINELQAKNWDTYAAAKKKADDDAAARAKLSPASRMGRAIMDVIPQSPFPTPLPFPKVIGR